CSATRVALEADRADGENDSKRKIAQGSISATASAAAYRSQNENVSAWFEPGVETRAFAFDEHVDVASNRWRRIAKTVPHARPARLKSVHHILDRLRLDLHDALGVGKERRHRLDRRNRRQVARDALPGLALVAACIDCA